MTSPRLSIALLSSTQFGYRCLTQGILCVPNISLSGIMTTRPEIPFGKNGDTLSIVNSVDFQAEADRTGCELAYADGKVTASTYLDVINRWNPDIVLVLGWYHILPPEVLVAPPLGCVAIHASLLPKYRGMAPINWAIINGETETGVSLFYLADGIDNGDVIAQRRVPIEGNDTCATLYDKATRQSVVVLRKFLPRLANGTAPRRKQNDDEATVFPKRTPEDGLIDWRWDSQRILNFVRAQTKPYPGAFTEIEGRRLYIWKAEFADDYRPGHRLPGSLVRREADVLIITCNGAIRLLDTRWADRQPLSDSQKLIEQQQRQSVKS